MLAKESSAMRGRGKKEEGGGGGLKNWRKTHEFKNWREGGGRLLRNIEAGEGEGAIPSLDSDCLYSKSSH